MSLALANLVVEAFVAIHDKPFMGFYSKEMERSHSHDYSEDIGHHGHFIVSEGGVMATDLATMFESRGWTVVDIEISTLSFTWEGVYPGTTTRYAVSKDGGPKFYIHHAVSDGVDCGEEGDFVHHIELSRDKPESLKEYSVIPTFAQWLNDSGELEELRKIVDQIPTRH